MLDRIKFPFMNMQQLNLDWLLEHVSHMPEIVQLPALAGDDLSDVQDMIDAKSLDIPKTICFIRCGLPDDNMERQCAALIFKIDNDNIMGLVMGLSANINVVSIIKKAGVWS